MRTTLGVLWLSVSLAEPRYAGSRTADQPADINVHRPLHCGYLQCTVLLSAWEATRAIHRYTTVMSVLQNVISTLTDMIARGWENFLARPQGTLNFRFILQPTIAAILALRAGVNDARNGRPAYLWAAFTKPVYRAQLLHGGWKDIRTPFLVSAVLDAIYQLITHRFIYPLELLFTATLLALVPYLILRGLVNRIASRFTLPDSAAEGADKNAGQ